MKRFRALSPVKGNERVDRSQGIIYGVAVNAAVEAKGHAVWLEEEFVNEVTKQGNLLSTVHACPSYSWIACVCTRLSLGNSQNVSVREGWEFSTMYGFHLWQIKTCELRK